MSDTLQETGSPDPLAPPAPADPPAALAKPKARKAPAKRKAAAKKPAAPKGKTAKVKFTGTSPTLCGPLADHGYPPLAQTGKIYELPVKLAEALVKSVRHFVGA